MMDFEIKNIVPRFILEDKNGYAMAKAIETGLKRFLSIAQQGLNAWNDPDKMPEWRLDELAWEYNIPYDYMADIEIKRRWIRSVHTLARLYGTPEGIIQFMTGYFPETTLQEAPEYGGDPFHFRVNFGGSWTPENVAWATKAINMVKNVRSVLDQYKFRAEWPHNLYAGTALYTQEKGTYQIEAVEMSGVNWYEDEFGNMLLDEDGVLLIVEG